MVPPGGMSTSSARLRMASDQNLRIFPWRRASTLLSRIQVWLKPIEQCGGTSVAPVFSL